MKGKSGSRVSEHDRDISRLVQYRAETGCCYEAKKYIRESGDRDVCLPFGFELFNVEQTRMAS